LSGFRALALAAAAGSAALLLAALGFQYLGGLAPCPICIWQRWPHGLAIALGALVLLRPWRPLALAGAAAMLADAGIGLYHTGIERRWWPGPDSCTAPPVGQMEAGELLDSILATPTVLCDQVVWQFLGLSMASWNAILSLALAVLWLRAYASSSASQ
jgi:disulfide bond formation protein DsbB